MAEQEKAKQQRHLRQAIILSEHYNEQIRLRKKLIRFFDNITWSTYWKIIELRQLGNDEYAKVKKIIDVEWDEPNDH